MRVIPLQAVQNVQRRKIPADLLAHKPKAVVRKPDTVVQLPPKEPDPHKAQIIVSTHPCRQQKVKNQVINFVGFNHDERTPFLLRYHHRSRAQRQRKSCHRNLRKHLMKQSYCLYTGKM